MVTPNRLRAFNVYLYGRLIDTIFYGASDTITADEVRRSLIDHDGYDPSIVVREQRKEK
jgi:hypothetical protein